MHCFIVPSLVRASALRFSILSAATLWRADFDVWHIMLRFLRCSSYSFQHTVSMQSMMPFVCLNDAIFPCCAAQHRCCSYLLYSSAFRRAQPRVRACKSERQHHSSLISFIWLAVHHKQAKMSHPSLALPLDYTSCTQLDAGILILLSAALQGNNLPPTPNQHPSTDLDVNMAVPNPEEPLPVSKAQPRCSIQMPLVIVVHHHRKHRASVQQTIAYRCRSSPHTHTVSPCSCR